ncbi:MAG: hemerythrin family protein [Bryobacterales bacterium]|nr:hemerythrin family protein [Bryobacterales bacterium]
MSQTTSLKLTWSSALETGDRATDVQHKYLVEIINELAEAIETGKAGQSVRKILNLLRQYTDWHFCREEMCMERRQCPAAAANKEAHKHFMRTFDQFAEEYKVSGGSEDIAMRMYKTLTDWLVMHIQKIDTNLASCPDNGCSR